jgi:hypothetical protein
MERMTMEYEWYKNKSVKYHSRRYLLFFPFLFAIIVTGINFMIILILLPTVRINILSITIILLLIINFIFAWLLFYSLYWFTMRRSKKINSFGFNEDEMIILYEKQKNITIPWEKIIIFPLFGPIYYQKEDKKEHISLNFVDYRIQWLLNRYYHSHLKPCKKLENI